MLSMSQEVKLLVALVLSTDTFITGVSGSITTPGLKGAIEAGAMQIFCHILRNANKGLALVMTRSVAGTVTYK